MLTGAYFAITQTDIKAILAYTTISALGVLVLLLGIDTKLSVKAALVFLFVHAFYKAALFMMAGYIDKKVGTREIDKLGGLVYKMPFAFLVSAIALLSMAGLPPLLGFIGKELIYEAKVQSPGLGSLILILGLTSNIFMVAVSLLFMAKVFFGKRRNPPKIPHLNKVLFLIGPGILAFFSLGFGLFPDLLSSFISPALGVIRAEDAQIKLKLWHGFNQVLMLSIFTVISGFALFMLTYRNSGLLMRWREINNRVFAIKLADLFSSGIERFVEVSGKYTRLIQHGYHRYYIFTIILFTTALLWFQVYITRNWQLDTSFTLKPFYISGLIGIIILATLYSAFSKSRITTALPLKSDIFIGFPLGSLTLKS